MFKDISFRKTTIYIIAVVAIGSLIYDILPAINAIDGDTISEVSRDYHEVGGLWILPYYTSVLLGHLWITSEEIRYKIIRNIFLLITLLLTAYVNLTIPSMFLHWYVTIPAGMLTGALLWPQRKKLKDTTI